MYCFLFCCICLVFEQTSGILIQVIVSGCQLTQIRISQTSHNIFIIHIQAVLIAEVKEMEISPIADDKNVVEISHGYFGWSAQPDQLVSKKGAEG